MAQINFPAASESPWKNTDSGAVYRYVNGAWQAIGIGHNGGLPEGNNIGDYLVWNGSAWVPAELPTELPDGNAAGDYLVWNGSAWAPANTMDGGVFAS